MKVINTYYTEAESRRVKITNRTDSTNTQLYSSVLTITEEVDDEYTRYAVLHHDSGETSTFPIDEWKIQVETFHEIW